MESILRQTLEVPMENVVTPSQEDIGRIEKLKVQLQSLGYNDDQVQRVSNELRPRLSHKEEIEKIATLLALAPDGDIASAWKSISQAHSGRALHHCIPRRMAGAIMTGTRAPAIA
jgi:hypothetical protein